MTTSEETKTFTIEFNYKEYEVEVTAPGVWDNYGADYDGNRGEWMWILEKVTWDYPPELTKEEQLLFDKEVINETKNVDWIFSRGEE